MHNAVVVQILESQANLERQLLGPTLRNLEAPVLDVVEQVASGHVVEHDVVGIRVLEQIYQADNVRMLTHLEHLNFSPLLVDFDWFHVLLVDCLDCHLLAVLVVSGQLDETKLALAEIGLKRVELEQICVANHCFHLVSPDLGLRLCLEVEQSRLVGRQHYLDWIEQTAFALGLLRRHLLDERPDKGVHYSVQLSRLDVLLLPVAVELVAS